MLEIKTMKVKLFIQLLNLSKKILSCEVDKYNEVILNVEENYNNNIKKREEDGQKQIDDYNRQMDAILDKQNSATINMYGKIKEYEVKRDEEIKKLKADAEALKKLL